MMGFHRPLEYLTSSSAKRAQDGYDALHCVSSHSSQLLLCLLHTTLNRAVIVQVDGDTSANPVLGG
eukprot:878995-Pelagomonas_calceolata.AAC.2